MEENQKVRKLLDAIDEETHKLEELFGKLEALGENIENRTLGIHLSALARVRGFTGVALTLRATKGIREELDFLDDV